MPFVAAPQRFKPDGDFSAKEKSTDPSKLKPSQLRNEQEFRNAALREGAFLGTLHLPVDYAGAYKGFTDKLRRSRDRMMRAQTFLENKVKKQYKDFKTPAPELPGGATEQQIQEAEKEHKLPRGIIKMRMREMREKKWTIIKDTGPPKVQKILAKAFDWAKMDWKREVKDKEEKEKIVEGYWAKLWQAKEDYVRNKKESAELEKKLADAKEKNPTSKTMLQDLCGKGVDINATRDDDGSEFTALMCAARNGHLETVKALLEMPDIDVNKVNSYGANAMHYAAMYAHKEVCQALRAAKCDRKAKNAAGKNPFHLAMDEHNDILNHKKEIWGEHVCKGNKFKVVDTFGKKDKVDDPLMIYNNGLLAMTPLGASLSLGMHNPDAVKPDKEWKPGKWRVSTIPDPACKLDNFSEAEFMKRWNSTAKKLPLAAGDKVWKPPPLRPSEMRKMHEHAFKK